MPPSAEPPDDPADDPAGRAHSDDLRSDDVRPAESRRRKPGQGVGKHRVAASGVAAAFALGLQQVFDPQPVDTVGIEQEAPAKPVDPDKLELRFDPGSSSNTVVVVRRPDDH